MTRSNTRKIISTEEPDIFRKKILDWYDKHRRVLPWRALPDQAADPYHVWLSEIMLQQTTVPAVIPYFKKFIDKWPDVHALANAHQDEIMSNWAGLGYYARARNLYKCAQAVSTKYKGLFPENQQELKQLPGIGDYTSAAICSIAFDKPATVVDGNVERVMARYHTCSKSLPEAKKELHAYAERYARSAEDRAGDYAQALMDLGATICTPKSPKCFMCPISSGCAGLKKGTPERYPVRRQKIAKPERVGYVYKVTNQKGEVLVEKRPDKGLLGGMYGLPTSEWKKRKSDHLGIFLPSELQDLNRSVKHVFTHFNLTLSLYSVAVEDEFLPERYIWFSERDIAKTGFPSVFEKAFKFF